MAITLVLFIASAVIVGVIAQRWKHRTGAGWGVIAALCWAAVYAFLLRASSTAQFLRYDDDYLWGAIAVIASAAVLGILTAIIATLPARDAPAGDLVPCPHCAEPIRAAAKLCRFCGRDLSTEG